MSSKDLKNYFLSNVEKNKQFKFTIINDDYFFDIKTTKINSKKTSFLSEEEKNFDNENKFKKPEINNLKASFILLISTLLFSWVNLIAKLLEEYYPGLDISAINLIRSLVMIILSYYYLNKENISLKSELNKPKEDLINLTIRAFSNKLANIYLLISLKHLRISTCFTIFNMSPIIVAIITMIFKNGKMTRLDFSSYIICLISVFFITKPKFLFGDDTKNEDEFIGIVYICIATFANAITIIFNKDIAHKFHSNTNVFFTTFSLFVVSGFILIFSEKGLSTFNIYSLFYTIIMGILFYWSMT